MQRSVWIFIAGTLGLVALLVAAGSYLMGQKSPLGGLVVGLTILAPLVMAFVAHRAGGATGNPFRGLTWGPTSWYFLAWLGGLAVGMVAIVLTLGLGFAQFDPNMTDYIEMSQRAAEEQSGEEMPPEMAGTFRIVGLVTAIAAPTIGPWIGAVVICLGMFPWLGFLYRRLLVRGKLPALGILALVWLLAGSSGGAVPNPMAEDMPLAMRMLLNGLASAAVAPASVWLFLRTNSAVIPSVAQASYQGMITVATVMFSDVNLLLGVPTGALGILALLLSGIALWLWKDPGGDNMAVAAIAGDGTPLSPQQLEALSRIPQFDPGAQLEPEPERETVARL